MARITDIRAQKNKKRFNIYLDQKFAFPLSAEELVKSGLEIGQEISEKDIRILRYKDTKNKLYERVLRFLSYRPRSEKEVRDYADGKLATRNHGGGLRTTEMVDEIIEKLKKQGLIDDQEFARWWVEQRLRFRPRGLVALKIELKRKGVDREIIEKIINQKFDELALAKKAVKKKLKKYQKLDALAFKQKISQYLLSRGFCWETIQKLLAETIKKG